MVDQAWFLLAMLAVVVLAQAAGSRLGVPSTILLTLAGLVYAVLPGPNLHLDPRIVLMLVLPPLLYSTARGSSLGSRAPVGTSRARPTPAPAARPA